MRWLLGYKLLCIANQHITHHIIIKKLKSLVRKKDNQTYQWVDANLS